MKGSCRNCVWWQTWSKYRDQNSFDAGCFAHRPCRPRFPLFRTIQDGFAVFPARFDLTSARPVPGEDCALGQAAESGETRDGKGGMAVRRSLLLQEFAALTGVSCVHSGMSGSGHDKGAAARRGC